MYKTKKNNKFKKAYSNSLLDGNLNQKRGLEYNPFILKNSSCH